MIALTYKKLNCFRKLFFIKPKKENATLETFLNTEYTSQGITVQKNNNKLETDDTEKL